MVAGPAPRARRLDPEPPEDLARGAAALRGEPGRRGAGELGYARLGVPAPRIRPGGADARQFAPDALAEGGWLVGWAHFAFLALALCGLRRSPRVGLAFAGLVLSACASTVFDWPVLFDFAEQGGLGGTNWILSWLTFALFVAFGVWLVVKSATQTGRRGAGGDGLDRIDKIDRIVEGGAPRLSNPANPVNPVRKTPCLPSSVSSVLNAAGMPVLFAGALVLAARCVPPGDAPRVQGGYAASGAAPRALALYDDSWSLLAVRARAGADALLPVRPVTRFPRGLDLSSVRCVLLFGDCREWAYLVPKGISVTCMED